jgi:DNA-binding NtrC family response regulator
LALAPQSKHVFLIEDEAAMRERVGAILRRAGYRVTAEAHGATAAEQLGSTNLDALIVAPNWPERETTKRVAALKRDTEGIPLLLVCAPGGVENAVRAMRHGVDDYVLRPPDPFELRARLERILDRQELDSRIAFFQDELSKRSGFKSLEASSPAMRAVVNRMMRVAPMRATVLVYGESGVGKELVARSIHFHSPRRERPFIALNCAAMPASLIESELFGHEKGAFTGAHARTRGKFEIAHRGTLFLDEIGEMDVNTQAKLLRVLEEREFMRIGGDQSIRVDVRLIAATNADLEEMVATSRFRQDLYYRLKVVTITVPPLRERRQDIPELCQTFLDSLSKANAVSPKRLEPEVTAALLDYGWPGNVRELKNLLESALISATGDSIGLEELPPAVRQSRSRPGSPEVAVGRTLAEMERELIVRTLEHTGGNRTHSARMLGIGVRTLQRKISSYRISIPSTRRRRRRTGKRES